MNCSFPFDKDAVHNKWARKEWIKDALCVGIKLCWLLNEFGQVVAWNPATMNVHDHHFHPLIEQITVVEPSVSTADS